MNIYCKESEFTRKSEAHRDTPLFFFRLGVVSPYAVVKGGGEAQPGQIGRQEQRGGAADGIPRHHGGSNSPGEKSNLNQCLHLTENTFNKL